MAPYKEPCKIVSKPGIGAKMSTPRSKGKRKTNTVSLKLQIVAVQDIGIGKELTPIELFFTFK